MPGRCQRRAHSLAAHAQPTEASADAEAAGRAGRAADHHQRDAHQTIKKFRSILFMSCKVLKGCCVAAHRSCWRAGCAVEHLCGVRQNVMGITFHVLLLFSFNAIQHVCASGVQELLAALDVQQTTISAAHMRVGQQLKQLQVLAFLVLSFCLSCTAAVAAVPEVSAAAAALAAIKASAMRVQSAPVLQEVPMQFLSQRNYARCR